MSGQRLFLDTVFVQALLNRSDQYHEQARALAPRLRTAAEVWTTEAVLIEIGNALSRFDRTAAARFIAQAYRTANMRVVGVDTHRLHHALRLYQRRPDKSWGLTDCISFLVMREHAIDRCPDRRRTLRSGWIPRLAAHPHPVIRYFRRPSKCPATSSTAIYGANSAKPCTPARNANGKNRTIFMAGGFYHARL
jgi:hypothetical protein